MFSLLNDNEMFLDVVGYEGLYSISNYGRVWSHLGRGRFLKPSPNSDGYLQCSLYSDGIRACGVKIHTLVGNAFVGKRENGLTFDHIDRNRQNNEASNLRLATRHQQNVNQNVRHDNKLREKNIFMVEMNGYSFYQIKMVRYGTRYRKYLREKNYTLADAVKVRDKMIDDLE